MKPVELFAPALYWRLTEAERNKYRCGPGRGLLERLVPETAYGLCITPACSIHDFMYSIGEDDKDKEDADAVFLNNMVRIIEAHTENQILLCLRLRRAKTYYQMVKIFGGPAFWAQKNLASEVQLVLA